jgi:hypothetical protein
MFIRFFRCGLASQNLFCLYPISPDFAKILSNALWVGENGIFSCFDPNLLHFTKDVQTQGELSATLSTQKNNKGSGRAPEEKDF